MALENPVKAAMVETGERTAFNVMQQCETAAHAVNETAVAILKNGYYEVNGFKFSEYYYNRLWNSGRRAPSLIAQSILDHAIEIAPDPRGYAGFYKYTSDGWSMIYNPTTKIVSHLGRIQ